MLRRIRSTNLALGDDTVRGRWPFYRHDFAFRSVAHNFWRTVCVEGVSDRLQRKEEASRMANKQNNSGFDANNPRQDDPEQMVLERIQELTWALLDETITDDEKSLLDTLLLTGDAARNRYLECVQLHTDLTFHFAEPVKAGAKSGSPATVLSFLNAGTATLDMPSPRTAE
jgi:hypothetical protein